MSDCNNINPNLHLPNAQLCPSPTPPWHRPTVSPLTNSIYGDGPISLTADTTYLNSKEIKMVDGVETPYVVTLPNGNHRRQTIQIFIETANLANQETAQFNVTGTFAGFTSLTFNSVNFSAVLEWSGSHWVLVGGNALANP